MAYHMSPAASARSEAPLMAIAQQLVHQQLQHQYLLGGSSIDFLDTSFADCGNINALEQPLGFASPDNYFSDPHFSLIEDCNMVPLCSSETTSKSDVCVEEMGDGNSEWMDCLMNDLKSEEGMVSYFGRNPCESTESSDLSACGKGYPCNLEDVWPDGFIALEEALFDRNGSFIDVSPSSWTHNTSPSYDILSASCPQFGNKFISQSQPPSNLHVMKSSEKLYALPTLREPKYITEARVWQNRGTCIGRDEGTRKMRPKAECKRGEEGSSNYGLQLLHLLLECAKCIDTEQDIPEKAIAHIHNMSSKQGDPIQRLAAYLGEALAKRMARKRGIITSISAPCLNEDLGELTMAYKVLNDACPYFKFAHLTANQAILEAMDAAERIHIIDFGISEGVQWAALLQAFATGRGRSPPRIRITGIGSPLMEEERKVSSLEATGRRLKEFAKILGLELEFNPIVSRMEEVDISMFRVEEGESVAVNFMLELHHLLRESLQCVERVLRVANSLRPKVLTLAEYDASLNGGSFQKRLMGALHFYGAIFDSLDAALPRDCAERQRVERVLFAEKIEKMMILGEGRRKRMQGREEWEAIMCKTGFHSISLSHYAISQARLLLSEGFSLTEGQNHTYLSLAWHQRPLLSVSAWSSSSSSCPSSSFSSS